MGQKSEFNGRKLAQWVLKLQPGSNKWILVTKNLAYWSLTLILGSKKWILIELVNWVLKLLPGPMGHTWVKKLNLSWWELSHWVLKLILGSNKGTLVNKNLLTGSYNCFMRQKSEFRWTEACSVVPKLATWVLLRTFDVSTKPLLKVSSCHFRFTISVFHLHPNNRQKQNKAVIKITLSLN